MHTENEVVLFTTQNDTIAQGIITGVELLTRSNGNNRVSYEISYGTSSCANIRVSDDDILNASAFKDLAIKSLKEIIDKIINGDECELCALPGSIRRFLLLKYYDSTRSDHANNTPF